MQKKNKANLGYGKEISPPAGQVKIYMTEKGFTEKEATTFLQTMLLRGWRTQTGRPIKNWKQYLFQWQYILRNPLRKSKRKCTRKNV
ncbi:MAG: hypothetical protein DI598_06395 [Pseudopedobacter saltans]|uniref:Uncharacterized protein n=1 Tax=Pseudopedobacter saltans TaxID=151895 RepID=A0A2W5F8I0_9SPHI|nr:MAG: hypothetical protein DI598_06395 [Pseudopedobacter saltans]